MDIYVRQLDGFFSAVTAQLQLPHDAVPQQELFQMELNRLAWCCWRFNLLVLSGGLQQRIKIARAVRILEDLEDGGLDRDLLHVDVTADDGHQTVAGADFFDGDKRFGVLDGCQFQSSNDDRRKRTDTGVADGDRSVDCRADARQDEGPQEERAGEEEIKQHQEQQIGRASCRERV